MRSVIDMDKGEQEGEVRKQIVDTIKHLAKYDLDVWNRAGPYVQTVLADEIERFSQDDLHMLRPIVLTIWHELLKSDVDSTSFSADMVTINSNALPVYEGIKAISDMAIDRLMALFDGE